MSKRLVIIVTAIFCLPWQPLMASTAPPAEVQKQLELAKVFLEVGELRQSQVVLKSLDKTYPAVRSHPSYAMLQSIVSEKLGDIPKATETLQSFHTKQTLLRSTVLLEISGQSLSALNKLKEIQELPSKNANQRWVNLTRANTAISLGQLDNATEALAIPFSENDLLAERVRDFLKGVVAFKKRQFPEARAFLDGIQLDKSEGFAPAVLSLRALAAAMEGDDKKTIELCNQALGQLKPGRERTSLLFLRGLAFQHQGQSDVAMGDFQAVAASHDLFLSPRAMLFSAHTLWLERDLIKLAGPFKKNLVQFREAMKPVAFSPQLLECDLLIAEALYSLKRYAEAEVVFKSLLDGSNVPYLVIPTVSGYVASLSAQKKFEAGTAAVEQAMVKFGADRALLKFGYFSKGHLAWNRGNFAEAQASYIRFAEMFPDDPAAPEALYYAGLSQEKLGQPAEALKTLEGVRTGYSSSPFAFRALVRQARVAEKAGDKAAAQKAYSLLAASGESGAAEGALFQLAKAELSSQNYKVAIQRFDDYLKRYPHSSRVSQARSFIQEAYGRVADTQPDLLLALAKTYAPASHAGEAYFRLGLREFDQQKYDKAGEYFTRVLSDFSTAPSAMEAMFYAAESDYQAGRYKESLTSFAQFVRGAPDHSLALLAQFHRARAMRKCGYDNDAAIIFKEIAKKAPESAYGVEAVRNIDEIAGKPE